MAKFWRYPLRGNGRAIFDAALTRRQKNDALLNIAQSALFDSPPADSSGPTILRPTADFDAVDQGWLPTTGGTLYEMLSEVSPDDSTYIYPDFGSSSEPESAISFLIPPGKKFQRATFRIRLLAPETTEYLSIYFEAIKGQFATTHWAELETDDAITLGPDFATYEVTIEESETIDFSGVTALVVDFYTYNSPDVKVSWAEVEMEQLPYQAIAASAMVGSLASADLLGGTPTAVIGRPYDSYSTGNWVAVGGTLPSVLSEVISDDSNYAYATSSGSLALSMPPPIRAGSIVRIRYKGDDVIFILRASHPDDPFNWIDTPQVNLPTSTEFSTFEYALTSTDMSGFDDSWDIVLHVIPGYTQNLNAFVSWAEIETPPETLAGSLKLISVTSGTLSDAVVPSASFLSQRFTRTFQPPASTQIQWSNPLNRALDIAYNPAARGLNFASAIQVSANGAQIVYRHTANGVAHVVNSAASTHISILNAPVTGAPSDVTILVAVKLLNFKGMTFGNSTPGSGAVLYTDAVFGDGLTLCVSNQPRGKPAATPGYGLFFGATGDTLAKGAGSNVPVEVGRHYILVGRFRANAGSGDQNGFSTFIDGVNVTAATQDSTGVMGNWAGYGTLVGASSAWGGVSSTADSEITGVFRWRRALSDDEIARVSSKLWGIFSGASRLLAVPSATLVVPGTSLEGELKSISTLSGTLADAPAVFAGSAVAASSISAELSTNIALEAEVAVSTFTGASLFVAAPPASGNSASLVRPIRLTRQPQLGISVDRSNPLTRNLIALVTHTGKSRAEEIVCRYPNDMGGYGNTGAVARASNGGIGYVFAGAGYNDGFTLSLTGGYLQTVTVFAVVVPLSNTSAGEVFNLTSGAFPQHGTLSLSSGVPTFAANGNSTISGDSALLANQIYVLVGTNDRPRTLQRLFVNGVQQTAVGSSGAQTSFDTDKIIRGRNSVSLLLLHSGAFSRILSDSEIETLSENPWQVFAPTARRLWIPANVQALPLNFDGGLSAESSAVATLTSDSAALSSSISAGSSVSASLSTGVSLSASVVVAPAATATIKTEINFNAAITTAASAVQAEVTTQIRINAFVADTVTTAADLSAAIRVATAISINAATSASLSTSIQLAAAISASVSAQATFTTGVTFEATPAVDVSAAGALSTAIQLATAIASKTNNVIATLNTGIPLAASPKGVASVVGGLSTGIPLAGSTGALATASAELSQTELNSLCKAQSFASATLATEIPLNAASAVLVTAAASLSATTRFAASLACSTIIVAGLTTRVRLAATPKAVSAIKGAAITTGVRLATSAKSISAATAELTGQIGFGAKAFSDTSAQASLSTQVRLAGVLASVADTQTSLLVPKDVASTIYAQATQAGDLATAIQLATARGAETNTIIATLNTGIPLAADIDSRTEIAADISTKIPLVARPKVVVASTGELSFNNIAAAAYSTSTANASLDAVVQIATNAKTVSTALADLSTGIWVGASAAAETSVDAELSTGISLVSSVRVDPWILGDIFSGIALVAAPEIESSVSAGLTTAAHFTAQAYAQSFASASLLTGAGFKGTVQSRAISAAELTTAIRLSATIAGASSTTTNLSAGDTTLWGSLVARVSATSSLATQIALATQVAGAGFTEADLGTGIALQGQTAAESFASAMLDAAKRLDGHLEIDCNAVAELSFLPQQFDVEARVESYAEGELTTAIRLRSQGRAATTIRADLLAYGSFEWEIDAEDFSVIVGAEEFKHTVTPEDFSDSDSSFCKKW